MTSLRLAERLWGAHPESDAEHPSGYRSALVALLAAAFVLRVGVAWRVPSIHQADEIYQVAEQANRAVNGYGIVSWEFQTASRPALLAVAVEPVFRLRASPETHQILIAALFALFSLIPVWVAFHWTARLYGVRAGMLAGLMMATWFELVYFGPKPTADAVCGYFFIAALFLGRPGQARARVLVAAFCLALAAGVRMQIAPAVIVALLAIALVDTPRRIGPLAAGVAAGVVLVGLSEWTWWGVPFLGHWRYLTMEFVHHASQYFGHEPLTFYLKNYVLIYGGALPLVALLLYLGARRAPVLFVAFVALVLPFHFVGHKEYRFLVPALPVMVLLMGLGAADAIARFFPAWTRATWVAAACGWLVAMVAISLGDTYRPFWTRDRNHIFAFRAIGHEPDACGVALARIRWYHTPGLSGLGRDIPIYELPDASAGSDAAN